MSDHDHRAWAEKTNETAVKMAHEILRTLIIVHGGATIAMLSFIGSTVGSGKLNGAGATLLAQPLMRFGWGIVITIGAMVGAYFTDYAATAHAFQVGNVQADPSSDAQARLTRLARLKGGAHAIAIALTIASMGAFVSAIRALEANIGEAFNPPMLGRPSRPTG